MRMGGAQGLGRIARRLLAAAFLAAFLPAAIADASTRACSQLEAQLAALRAGGGGGSSTQARRYDAAIGRQQEQMRKARAQAQQAGCGRAMVGGAVSFCGSINATLQRMESNLAELQRTRARLGGGGDSRRERARITAALDANGCRAQQRARSAQTTAAPRQQAVIDGRPGLRVGNLSGNFRTMCVRTCDGYYFPVSWSVSRSAFERDQNACAAMCPGTQVELHYHRVRSQESEDMVSAVTGLPYRQMSNAFLYRQSNASTPPGCGCGASASAERGFEVIGGDYGGGIVRQPEEMETVTAAIPQPSARPDPAEDPETLAGRDGGLDARTLRRLATPIRRPPPAAAADGSGERAVRVVGPVFLPDPEAAIDLQAPAPAPDP